jgi:hypothetical protein
MGESDVRAKRGQLLLGLGAFLLVLAALLKFYAYPQLAVAPIDQNSESILIGPDATVFDIGSLSEIDTDLTTSARTVGDIEASEEAGDDVRVWVNTSSTTDSDGVVRSRSVDRVAFDAHTGEAVNCCDEFYETVEGEQTPVEHQGLVFKFPFGTEKTTYDWWDSTLLEAVPIEYTGTEEVAGYETYVFEHTIEPTVTGTIEVPADVLGEEGEDSLEADRVYSNVRTLWVEPNTGVVLKRTEQQDNYLEYDGERRVTTTEVTTGYTEETTQDFADEYGGLGRLLNLANVTLPIVFVVLGLVLVVGGVLLYRRDHART